MTKYYQIIFNLLALTIIIFLCVEIFYILIRAQLTTVNTQGTIAYNLSNAESHSKLTVNSYKAITKRNIFGSREETSEEIQTEEIENLQPTSLKLALLGTVSGNRKNAFAVIEEIDKKTQALYRVGDNVQGALLKKIFRGKVILRINGKDEILNIKEDSSLHGKEEVPIPEITNEGTTKVISRSAVQESMNNLHNLLSQVRVRPYFRDGKADGLLVTDIQSESLFAELGLKNGDVIQGIDDRIIQSPEDVLEVYKKFQLGSQVALRLMRNNEQKIINYTFR